MKILILLAILCCCSLGQFYKQEALEKELQSISVSDLLSYNKWKLENKRQYFSQEESNYRQLLFLKNLQDINKHNSKKGQTYQVGINQFTDLTQEEFAAIALNPLLSEQAPEHNRLLQRQENPPTPGQGDCKEQKCPDPPTPPPVDPLKEVPQSVDWRLNGKVSPVKNQGGCGSCWAFSTNGLLESVNLLRNNTLAQYSEQELVDCTLNSANTTFYNYGCGGGWPTEAHRYIQTRGISLQSAYPYRGNNGSCRVNSTSTKALFAGQPIYPWSNNPNRTNIVQYHVSLQPLSVLVDATNWSSYKTGVFNNCGTNINHAVLLIGYTPEGNWIIKNSWGTSWGQQGFMILAPGNTCAIQSNPLGSTV